MRFEITATLLCIAGTVAALPAKSELQTRETVQSAMCTCPDDKMDAWYGCVGDQYTPGSCDLNCINGLYFSCGAQLGCNCWYQEAEA